jgi:hypothetical protein
MSYEHEAKRCIMQNKMVINRLNFFLDFFTIDERTDR